MAPRRVHNYEASIFGKLEKNMQLVVL